MVELTESEVDILIDEFSNISNKLNNNNILHEVEKYCNYLRDSLPDVQKIQAECGNIQNCISAIKELEENTVEVYNATKNFVESAKIVPNR